MKFTRSKFLLRYDYHRYVAIEKNIEEKLPNGLERLQKEQQAREAERAQRNREIREFKVAMNTLVPLEVGGKRKRNSYSAEFKFKIIEAL